jgi:hypothetical protein
VIKTINKTKKSRDTLTSRSKETQKNTSEENIRDRAFEICLADNNSSLNKLINRYYTEREMCGYYMYPITGTNSQK